MKINACIFYKVSIRSLSISPVTIFLSSVLISVTKFGDANKKALIMLFCNRLLGLSQKESYFIEICGLVLCLFIR